MMDPLSTDTMNSDGPFDIASSMIHSESSIFGSIIGSPGSVFRSTLDFACGDSRLDDEDIFNQIQGPSASSVESKTRRRKASQPQRLVYCDLKDGMPNEGTRANEDDSLDEEEKLLESSSGDVHELTQMVQISSSTDNPVVPEASLEPHEQLSEFKCNSCSETFQDQASLNKHSRSHVNRVQCPHCGLLVFNKTALRNHVKRIHEKPERMFKCTICDKSFVSKSELSSHLFIHSEEKKFSCPTCNKKFASKNYLEKHLKTHAGIKPFKCDVCGKSIADKTGFVAHVRAHSGERPYACSLCDKRYTIKRHLTSHEKIHTNARPYMCEVPGCGKTFRSRSNLRMHKDFHAGVKRWSCSYCNRSFLSQGNMAKHIRRHVGDKKFTCDVCGKSFIEKQELRNHTRVHGNRGLLVRTTSTGDSVESGSSTPSPTSLTPLRLTRSGSYSSATQDFLPESNDNSPCEVSSSLNDPFTLKTSTGPQSSSTTTAPHETSDQLVMITVIHDTGQQQQHTNEPHTGTCQLISHPSSGSIESVTTTHVAIPAHVESLSFSNDGNFVTSSILSTSGIHPLNMNTSGEQDEPTDKLPSLGFPYHTMSNQVFNCTLCSNYYPEATMLRHHLIEYHRVEQDKIH